MKDMATIHISETEAARDFAGLIARARTGAEIVIEDGKLPVAVLHLRCRSAVAAHREPLNPLAWD